MRSSAQGLGASFWALIGATFLGFLGIGTVLPALAPHVRYELGGSDRTVGFVIGTFSVVALLSRFVSGYVADHKGRKIAFLAGLFSCGLAGGAYLLPIGIGSAYLGRALQGFGEACLYTGAAAWVVELAGVHRSARALGFLSSGIWGGISAGPLVGSWLGSFEHAAMMQVVAAIAAFAILWWIKEDYVPEPHPKGRTWLNRSLLAPGLAVGFVNVHYPVVAGFLILHLAQHGDSGRMTYSAYAFVILSSRFFLGGLPDRINPGITYYGGLALMAFGLVVLSAGPSPAIAIGAGAVLGFGFSFPWSSIAATVLRRTPARERGSVVSVLSAFYDLFVGMSSFAAGAISERFGYAAAFQMAAIALIAASLVGRIVFRNVNPIPAEVEEQLTES